jgi:hypothetical protein
MVPRFSNGARCKSKVIATCRALRLVLAINPCGYICILRRGVKTAAPALAPLVFKAVLHHLLWRCRSFRGTDIASKMGI